MTQPLAPMYNNRIGMDNMMETKPIAILADKLTALPQYNFNGDAFVLRSDMLAVAHRYGAVGKPMQQGGKETA